MVTWLQRRGAGSKKGFLGLTFGAFGALGVLYTTALLSALPAFAQNDIQVQVELSPQVASLEDYVYFSVQIQRRGLQSISLRPAFEVENLDVIGPPARQRSVGLGFGGQRQNLTLVWRLRPQAPGPARVHSIRLLFLGEGGIEEQVFEIPEKRIDIVEATAAPPAPQDQRHRPGGSALDPWLRRMMPNLPPIRGRPRAPGSSGGAGQSRQSQMSDLFLKTFVSTEQPYVGQKVEFLAYLYSRLPIRNIQLRRIPDFAGLWVREVPPPPAGAREERVQVGGEIYSRFLLFHRQLYALRPGAYDLEPVTARIEAGGVLDPFGSSYGIPAVSDSSSEEIRLVIQAPPAPAPDGFEGLVGQVTLEARLSPQEIDAEGAATIELSVGGDAYLESLEAPRPPSVDGLRFFAPQQGAGLPRSPANGVPAQAQRRWTYVVTVDPKADPALLEKGHSFEIPPFEMSYFDPPSGSYQRTQAFLPPLVLRSPPEPSGAGDGSPGAEAAGLESGDAKRNSPSILEGLRASGIGGRTVWTILAALLLLGLLGLLKTGLFGLRKRLKPQGWISGTSRLSPEDRKSLGKLEEGFREAASINRPRRAAARCEEAWRRFLQSTFDLPAEASAMTWVPSLSDLGVRREPLAEFEDRLEELRALRHAPELSDTATLIADLGQHASKTAAQLLRASSSRKAETDA